MKEALTGKKGYISASVSKLCPDTDPYYPRTTDDIVDITEFENISKRQNSETTVTYGFRSKDKMKTNIIYASLSTTTADTSGRMRSYENYYKGKQMGWYIVLDEETDYEGTVQSKLDKPILVFRESSGKAGIYIQGIYYKDANNPFE